MEVVSGLTTPTIVLCVDKRDRAIALGNLLKKNHFKVLTVTSLYEGLKYVQQEMPHLVICDSILSDGTAGTLYDRLSKNELLKSTPILVLVAKKTREQLTPLTGRKFAGFILGNFEGSALLTKVNEILATNQHLSPYYVRFDGDVMNPDFTMAVDSMAMGLSGDSVVYKSQTEIDSAAAMVCVPEDHGLGPVLLTKASNMSRGEDVYNLFPMARIRGKGRRWIEKLPTVEVSVGKSEAQGKKRRVVFYDPNEERIEQFRSVLEGYDIDILGAPSFIKAVQMIQRDSGQINGVYLHELTGGNVGTIRDLLEKLDEKSRPKILVGTSSLNMRDTTDIRYIKKPFGLGTLLEMLEMAFKSQENLAEQISKAHGGAHFVCSYQAAARLLGLDETGGLIQLKFPLIKGNRLKLAHPFLERIWEGDVLAEITHSGPLPQKPDIWQARFIAVSSKGNKAKYWERVEKSLKETFGDIEGLRHLKVS